MSGFPPALTADAVLDASHQDSPLALLDLMRSVTGWQGAALTVLEEREGLFVHDIIARSVEPSDAATVDALNGLVWLDPVAVAARLARVGVRGCRMFPVMGLDAGVIVGAVWLVDAVGTPLVDDVDAVLTLLAGAASIDVLRESGIREHRRTDEVADSGLIDTLQAVRRAEDQVGNSVAVVLGWLRVMSDGGSAGDSPSGGVQIAIRRLEEAQAVIAELLRTTASGAIHEHASDRVSVKALLHEAGLLDLASGSAADVYVLANRTHLSAFLSSSAPFLSPEAVTTPDLWLVPITRPDQIGSASLLSLHASGGSFASHGAGQAAAWTRAVPPATA